MTTHPDFEELLRLLEENHVDYMIVGGYAVAYHGHPRFTKDMDIFYDQQPGNLERLRSVMLAFGFKNEELPDTLFTERGNIITFGLPPTRIDLLNEIDGVSFAEAAIETNRGRYGDVEVTFIGKPALIKNKLATQRPQDKVDADRLG